MEVAGSDKLTSLPCSTNMAVGFVNITLEWK
jgi:hypothetical protein